LAPRLRARPAHGKAGACGGDYRVGVRKGTAAFGIIVVGSTPFQRSVRFESLVFPLDWAQPGSAAHPWR
jgi:hypothetical protein